MDIIGWIGASLILLAYYLISNNKVKSNSVSYQLINLIGAACLVLNAYSKGAIPLVALNIVWIAIAIKGLLKK